MQSPPQTIFHYTSATGLLGIIQRKELWCTKIQCLNDSTEYRYAAQIAQKVMKPHLHRSAYAHSRLDELSLPGIEAFENEDVFVASFSERGDALSQWRGYCHSGHGYAIGFNSELLRKVAITNGYRLAPCIYSAEEQERVMSEIVQHALAAGTRIDKPDEIDIETFGLELFKNFLDAAPTFKHPAFMEESEWRIISGVTPVMPETVKWRVGKSSVVPFRPLRIEDSYWPDLVHQIIVGPNTDQTQAVNNARSLVSSIWPKHSVQITKSIVPYRNW